MVFPKEGTDRKECSAFRLHADDMLLFVTVPEVSIPRLMSSLKDCESYSGYKLNAQKSQIPIYNYAPQKDTLNRFEMEPSDIKYLGIHIPKVKEYLI